MSFFVLSLSGPCLSGFAGLTRMTSIRFRKGHIMPSTQTALLVIDAQESFRHRPYWTDDDVPAFVDRVQALVDGAVRAGIRVVQVLHVDPSGPFSLASGNVRTLAPLAIEPNAVFHKSRH